MNANTCIYNEKLGIETLSFIKFITEYQRN